MEVFTGRVPGPDAAQARREKRAFGSDFLETASQGVSVMFSRRCESLSVARRDIAVRWVRVFLVRYEIGRFSWQQ